MSLQEKIDEHNKRVGEAFKRAEAGETICLSGLMESKARLQTEAQSKGGGTVSRQKVSKRGDLEASTFQDLPAYRYIRISDKVPSTDEALRQENPMALVKLFDPTGSWTWFISGYDPETRIATGRVHGLEDEYGDFGMEELVELRGRFGLPIERDLYWEPRPLKDCNR